MDAVHTPHTGRRDSRPVDIPPLKIPPLVSSPPLSPQRPTIVVTTPPSSEPTSPIQSPPRNRITLHVPPTANTSLLQQQVVGVDLLDAGPVGVEQMVELLSRARHNNTAMVRCGGPAAGAIWLGNPVPAWTYKWLSGSVLCFNVTASDLLNNIVAGLCPRFAGDLFRLSKELSHVVDAPRLGGLVVQVWQQNCVVVHAIVDEHSALPDPKAFAEYANAQMRTSTAHSIRFMKAAHYLQESNVQAAAAAMGINEQDLFGLVSPPIQSAQPQATSAFKWARDFCHYEAAFHVTQQLGSADIPRAQPIPDVAFVLPPSNIRALFEFAQQQAAFILAGANERDLASTTARPATAAAKPEFVPECSDIDPVYARISMHLSEQVLQDEDSQQTSVLPLGLNVRTAAHLKQMSDEREQKLVAVAWAINECTKLLVGCISDADDLAQVLLDAQLPAALADRAAALPFRYDEHTFFKLYAGLLRAPAPTPGDRAAAFDDLMEGVASGDAVLVNERVLLSRSAHEHIQGLQRTGRPDADELIRSQLALEQQRMQRAFPDEYTWLARRGSSVASVRSPRPKTPRAASGPGRPLTARGTGLGSDTGESTPLEDALTRLFCCPAATELRADGLRWSTIIGLRLLRALGWMESSALPACAMRLQRCGLAAQRTDRMRMFVALAELACLATVMAPRQRDYQALNTNCTKAVATAVHAAAKLHAQVEKQLIITAITEAATDASRKPFVPFSDLPALSPHLIGKSIVAHFDRVLDAEVANTAGDACKDIKQAAVVLGWICTLQLQARLPRLTAVVKALICNAEQLAQSALAELLQSEWLAELAQKKRGQAARKDAAKIVPCKPVAEMTSVPTLTDLPTASFSKDALLKEMAGQPPAQISAALVQA